MLLTPNEIPDKIVIWRFKFKILHEISFEISFCEWQYTQKFYTKPKKVESIQLGKSTNAIHAGHFEVM